SVDDRLEHDDCGCTEYNALSRRQFVSASAIGGLTAFFPAWLPRITLAETYASTRDVMLSIFLRGGADGLAVCVPYGEPNYYASRTTIAIPRPDATNAATRGTALDNFFALPQAMNGLLPAYNAKDLLVVHAAGQLNTT